VSNQQNICSSHGQIWFIAAAFLAFACLPCNCEEDPLEFPEGYLFGTAIAGFQADMGCPNIPAEQCEDRNADWYVYITNIFLRLSPFTYLSGDAPSLGPGFYELYEEDLDRASNDLQNNAFRLSIEWSRIFPEPTDGVSGYDALRAVASADGIDYYHRLFAAMKARNLRPFVTLNHYSLPTWIHDSVTCHFFFPLCNKRGWVDGTRIVREIAKFAGFVASEYAGEVDLWATLNEPISGVLLSGYIRPGQERTNPPGIFLQIWKAKDALRVMIEAHAQMYDAVKANDLVDADSDGISARVGTVYNLQPVVPANPTDQADVRAADDLSYYSNFMFLDAVVLGLIDEKWERRQVYRSDLEGKMDFLGINYYGRIVVKANIFTKLLGSLVPPLLSYDPLSVEVDYNYTRGVGEVLKTAWDRYSLPLILSETGRDDPDDSGRMRQHLIETLVYTRRAMTDNVPVEGYFFWTLADNYEWNHGMNMRYGLYEVDIESAGKTRHARSPVAVYREIASTGRISVELNNTVA